MTTRELILKAYSAFNERDIDAALALMSESVSWPKASEGGRVVGKQAIRAYWTRQWSEFDPHVDVLEVAGDEAGAIAVKVHQLVRDMRGNVLSDSEVRHVYSIVDDRIDRMDVKDEDGDSTIPSAAFATGSHPE